MLKAVFYALTYWAPALLLCLVIGARVAAPYPYDGPEYTQSVAEGLTMVARELADKRELYVKVDGHDPGTDLLADLNSRNLPATFSSWSARPAGRDRCPTSIMNPAATGACMQDNFLAADFLSMPLWHVALLRVKTAACTAELTVVHGATRWHVLSQRAVCT
jgi:hypothetical protein